ncbi:MAG: DNA translocase FtsK 4TM domain-containing protein [Tidjanibacter sp.]|nr:DNA translocase FtsK 4TM domain-containing protein [Tidjanibacter sp.]
MATKRDNTPKKRAHKAASQPAQTTERKRWSPSENQRWVICFTLFFISLFVLMSIVSYYFTWREDQIGGAVANNGGSLGLKIGQLLVGDWFGVCALGVPIVVMLLSLRIMLGRKIYIEKALRTTLIVMILGSLTAGFVFGTKWDVFGSGLGGKMGIDVARWIEQYIGNVGLWLLLLMLWILFAVYVNSKTINTVNKVASKGVDLFRRHDGEENNEDEDEDSCDEEYYGREVTTKPEEDGVVLLDSDPEEEINHPYAAQDGSESGEGDDLLVINLNEDEDEVAQQTAPQAANTDNDSHVVLLDDDEEDNKQPYKQTSALRVEADDDDEFQVIKADGGMNGLPQNSEVAGAAVAAGATAVASGVAVGEDILIGTGGVIATGEDGQVEIIKQEHQEDEAGRIGSLYDPTRELSRFQRPPLEILDTYDTQAAQIPYEEIEENKNLIQTTLESFGIKIKKITATIGPTVTLYEIEPTLGTKVAKIKSIEDDIAISLKAMSIRMIVPMPGRGTIGIEIPNRTRRIVSMHSVVRSAKFQESKYELPIVLGKTIQNETFVIDLAKMPHLLVAGATGQGKSVGLNVSINSLLYKKHPAELKFVMVDPKKVELSLYSKLEKHYLAKMESEDSAILTDTQKVVYTLNSLCNEMQARYDLLQHAEVKKISEYNQKFLARKLNPNKGHRFLPYIVVVIDEFADMIMTAGKEVETPIIRLGQLARAVGIHLIIATQRPDVKVITGLIKANFPARIAFKVTSIVDSRTIIDQTGANKLIGMGDMLMMINGELTRLQCAFLDTPEIERITNFIAKQKGYESAYLLPDYVPEDGGMGSGGGVRESIGNLDSMFEEIARFVVNNQQGSTSFIQRKFNVGYNRAGRIMDQLEQAGIVGRSEGSKPREVLISDPATLERILNDLYIDNL